MTDVDKPIEAEGHSQDHRSGGVGPDGRERRVAVFFWVTMLGGYVVNGLNKAFAPFGINSLQFLIIYLCGRQQVSTVSDLAAVAPYDASTISRNVEKLRSMGLLTAHRRKPDRRVLHLAVTEEGRSMLAELAVRARQFEAEVTQDVSDGEKTLLVGIMRKMVAEARGGGR